MERKVHFLALTITVAAVILFNVSLYSSMKEDRIESFTKQSCMFKSYLQGEDLKIQLKDGVSPRMGRLLKNPINGRQVAPELGF
ncbi:MAG: hypothetical protein HY911_09730 [Desulfobacterales bacterium]|nr:hypothetical protein [Desulfobacterales bacterium]